MAQLTRTIRDSLAQHPRENQRSIALLASLNSETIIDVDGCSSFILDLRGTFVGTIEMSGTTDGVNWLTMPMKAYPGSGNYVLAATTAGVWVAPCAGFTQIRARMIAYTSGSATTTITGCLGVLAPDLFDSTPNYATVTAAVGVAATLTIASPGAGLRIYLTYLRIARIASATLTAAATPIIVTTSNLPGAMAFSIQADAAAQGVIFDYQESFNYPIAAVAQNTATTIVAPVATGVIWRITAGYQIRP